MNFVSTAERAPGSSQRVLCVVRNNRIVGFYGILLGGGDAAVPDWLPGGNAFDGNDVFGSSIGCAERLEDEVWRSNNCAGVPDSGPSYF